MPRHLTPREREDAVAAVAFLAVLFLLFGLLGIAWVVMP